MTSPDATNVPCEGCPDVAYPPAPDVPTGQTPSTEDVFKRLPGGTSGGPLPEKSGLIYSDVWGIHLGGTPEDHLVSVVLAIPEGFTRIFVHEDGSLEYKKGPDDFEPPNPINGYERDLKNQWLFKPLWKSCAMRYYGVVVKDKCKCIDVTAKCSVNSHWVKYEDCLRCKARLPIEVPLVPIHKSRQNLRLPDRGHNSK